MKKLNNHGNIILIAMYLHVALFIIIGIFLMFVSIPLLLLSYVICGAIEGGIRFYSEFIDIISNTMLKSLAKSIQDRYSKIIITN